LEEARVLVPTFGLPGLTTLVELLYTKKLLPNFAKSVALKRRSTVPNVPFQLGFPGTTHICTMNTVDSAGSFFEEYRDTLFLCYLLMCQKCWRVT